MPTQLPLHRVLVDSIRGLPADSSIEAAASQVSRMGRVLLTWELGGGLGHLVNLKPFAQQLSRRGHEVFAALKDVTGAAEVFGNARVAYLQAPICAPGGTHVDLPRTFAEIMHNNGFCDLGSIRSLCQAWRHLYEYVQPDLIVFDHSPMAMLAARGLDAKRVMVGTGFFCPPLSYPLPDLRPALDSDPMELRRCEDAVLARMNDAAAEWGLPPRSRASPRRYRGGQRAGAGDEYDGRPAIAPRPPTLRCGERTGR